jgi:hypothetical protein
MSTEPKKSRIAHVPSILAGTAAVIAAASTLYVNLREDARPAPDPTPPAPVSAAAAPAAASAAAAPKIATQPRKLLLRLDRVQVDNDGSAGSTDWNFQVSVDGDPQFSVPMPALDDTPGENLVRPADPEQASAEIELPAGRSVALSVNGWKKSWLPGSHAEVSGKAWLGFNKTTVTVQTAKEKGPRFVLYFSATPAK